MAAMSIMVAEFDAVSIVEALIFAVERLGYVSAIVETGGGRDGLRAFIAYKDSNQMYKEIRGQ